MRTFPDELVESETVPLGPFLLDEGKGPALPITEAEARALVARVIAAGQPRAPRGRARKPRAWMFIGAVTVATSAAAAAYQRDWPVPWLTRDDERRTDVASRIDSGAASVRRSGGASEELARNVAETPPTEPPRRMEPTTSEAGPRLEDTPGDTAKKPAGAVPRSRGPAASKARAHASEPARERAARDELSRANALRGERRYSEAMDAYLKVIELNPKGLPAQAARVAAAAIALERFGDSRRAARLYSEAAARGGELGAEAVFGLAETQRARGDRAAEKAALERFLRDHRQHPLATAARRRLQTLNDR